MVSFSISVFLFFLLKNAELIENSGAELPVRTFAISSRVKYSKERSSCSFVLSSAGPEVQAVEVSFVDGDPNADLVSGRVLWKLSKENDATGFNVYLSSDGSQRFRGFKPLPALIFLPQNDQSWCDLRPITASL
eukprot:c19445_g1_i1.p1 GENE.c19445_g1_i1~~c19445_g1_i1.p1  ORF type:complete len:134 (+),score=20.25 c19445_g1_i1:115-516(+)